MQQVIASAEELKIDPKKISIGGISAGANLAAVTAIAARDAGINIIFQLLVVPVVDGNIFDATGSIPLDSPYQSWIEFKDNPVLSFDRMSWFYSHYTGAVGSSERESLVQSATISPIRASLAGLPPTFVATAEIDILRVSPPLL